MTEQAHTPVPLTAQPSGDTEHPPQTPEAVAARIARQGPDHLLDFVQEDRYEDWCALVAAVAATWKDLMSDDERNALEARLHDALPADRHDDTATAAPSMARRRG